MGTGERFNAGEDIVSETQQKIEKDKPKEIPKTSPKDEREGGMSEKEQKKAVERGEKMDLIKKQIQEARKLMDDTRSEKEIVAEKTGLNKARKERDRLDKNEDSAGTTAYKEVVRLQYELDDTGFLTLNPLKWIKHVGIKRQLEKAVLKYHALSGAKQQRNEEVWKLEAQTVGDINKRLGVYTTQVRLLEDEYKKLEKEEDEYTKAVQRHMTSRSGFNY